MTEAGEQWVGDHMIDSGWKIASGHIAAEAEFWLRALCAEVEKRAAGIEGGSNEDGVYRLIDLEREEAVGQAFDELQRELLGEK